jgi:hypothetical protein
MTPAQRQRRYRRSLRVKANRARTEWLTSPMHIKMVRRVLGGIDLDPCTCAHAQAYIRARKFYTVSDDSLSQKWNGKTWVNPPFSQTGDFVDKLISEIKAKHVQVAILLANSNTSARWFHRALLACQGICFPRERLKFQRSDQRSTIAAMYGHAFFYFGSDVGKFRDVFGAIGPVIFTAFRNKQSVTKPIARGGTK